MTHKKLDSFDFWSFIRKNADNIIFPRAFTPSSLSANNCSMMTAEVSFDFFFIEELKYGDSLKKKSLLSPNSICTDFIINEDRFPSVILMPLPEPWGIQLVHLDSELTKDVTHPNFKSDKHLCSPLFYILMNDIDNLKLSILASRKKKRFNLYLERKRLQESQNSIDSIKNSLLSNNSSLASQHSRESSGEANSAVTNESSHHSGSENSTEINDDNMELSSKKGPEEDNLQILLSNSNLAMNSVGSFSEINKISPRYTMSPHLLNLPILEHERKVPSGSNLFHTSSHVQSNFAIASNTADFNICDSENDIFPIDLIINLNAFQDTTTLGNSKVKSSTPPFSYNIPSSTAHSEMSSYLNNAKDHELSHKKASRTVNDRLSYSNITGKMQVSISEPKGDSLSTDAFKPESGSNDSFVFPSGIGEDEYFMEQHASDQAKLQRISSNPASHLAHDSSAIFLPVDILRGNPEISDIRKIRGEKERQLFRKSKLCENPLLNANRKVYLRQRFNQNNSDDLEWVLSLLPYDSNDTPTYEVRNEPYLMSSMASDSQRHALDQEEDRVSSSFGYQDRDPSKKTFKIDYLPSDDNGRNPSQRNREHLLCFELDILTIAALFSPSSLRLAIFQDRLPDMATMYFFSTSLSPWYGAFIICNAMYVYRSLLDELLLDNFRKPLFLDFNAVFRYSANISSPLFEEDFDFIKNIFSKWREDENKFCKEARTQLSNHFSFLIERFSNLMPSCESNSNNEFPTSIINGMGFFQNESPEQLITLFPSPSRRCAEIWYRLFIDDYIGQILHSMLCAKVRPTMAVRMELFSTISEWLRCIWLYMNVPRTMLGYWISPPHSENQEDIDDSLSPTFVLPNMDQSLCFEKYYFQSKTLSQRRRERLRPRSLRDPSRSFHAEEVSVNIDPTETQNILPETSLGENYFPEVPLDDISLTDDDGGWSFYPTGENPNIGKYMPILSENHQSNDGLNPNLDQTTDEKEESGSLTESESEENDINTKSTFPEKPISYFLGRGLLEIRRRLSFKPRALSKKKQIPIKSYLKQFLPIFEDNITDSQIGALLIDNQQVSYGQSSSFGDIRKRFLIYSSDVLLLSICLTGLDTGDIIDFLNFLITEKIKIQREKFVAANRKEDFPGSSTLKLLSTLCFLFPPSIQQAILMLLKEEKFSRGIQLGKDNFLPTIWGNYFTACISFSAIRHSMSKEIYYAICRKTMEMELWIETSQSSADINQLRSNNKELIIFQKVLVVPKYWTLQLPNGLKEVESNMMLESENGINFQVSNNLPNANIFQLRKDDYFNELFFVIDKGITTVNSAYNVVFDLLSSFSIDKKFLSLVKEKSPMIYLLLLHSCFIWEHLISVMNLSSWITSPPENWCCYLQQLPIDLKNICTPFLLFHALIKKNYGLLSFLLTKQGVVAYQNLPDSSLHSPLCWAIKKKDKDLTLFLINIGLTLVDGVNGGLKSMATFLQDQFEETKASLLMLEWMKQEIQRSQNPEKLFGILRYFPPVI